ncbi:unnamed protein product [Musa textilis]
MQQKLPHASTVPIELLKRSTFHFSPPRTYFSESTVGCRACIDIHIQSPNHYHVFFALRLPFLVRLWLIEMCQLIELAHLFHLMAVQVSGGGGFAKYIGFLLHGSHPKKPYGSCIANSNPASWSFPHNQGYKLKSLYADSI